MSQKQDGSLVLIDICLRSDITVSLNMDTELNSHRYLGRGNIQFQFS